MECTNPTGCSLDGGEMAERVDAWRAVSSNAIRREVRPGRITSVYPPDPGLTGRLEDLVAAEAACCSFLRFTIQEQPHQTVVELKFPEEARSLVESVMGTNDPAVPLADTRCPAIPGDGRQGALNDHGHRDGVTT